MKILAECEGICDKKKKSYKTERKTMQCVFSQYIDINDQDNNSELRVQLEERIEVQRFIIL
jgi:hypothetical protein